jgi:nucleotide-binding universal stress UspA family protein
MIEQAVPFRKVLVATDFSEGAAAALRQAARLSRQTGAEVTVLHVLEEQAAEEEVQVQAHWRVSPADLLTTERRLRQETGSRLEDLVAPFRTLRSELHTATRVGIPFEEIIRAVLAEKYDLVMVGTRGLSWLKRLLVGSTAERLVRKCSCPVWVVKPGHEGALHSILAPVDFSDVSVKCLELAGALARRSACPLTVLHVLDIGADDVVQVPEDAARLELRLQGRAVRRGAIRRLRELVRAHVPAEVTVVKRLTAGPVWQRIDAAARRLEADLIVMGSQGRTGIPGFLIGNTAEKVLRHCDRSLLTVKPDNFVSPVHLEA